MTDYKPNMYERIQVPWVLVMWGLLAMGLFLMFLQEDMVLKVSGFGILGGCMLMLIIWVTRINPRAAKIPEKEEVKRKNKSSVYRPSKKKEH
jgi:multisubunit Na+/H+ antiporter MnhC subunit